MDPGTLGKRDGCAHRQAHEWVEPDGGVGYSVFGLLTTGKEMLSARILGVFLS